MAMRFDGTGGNFFPQWTTATRPTSPSTGQTGFNTDNLVVESYNGTKWVALGGQK